MIISKNSILRLLLYIGILISTSTIENYVRYHFLYVIKLKIFCPALGSVQNCELGILAARIARITVNTLIGLLFLKATEKLKYNKVLGRIEPLMCTLQVPVQLWFVMYFACMSADSGSTEDVRVTLFISNFLLISFIFALNGILSYLDQLTTERRFQQQD